MHDAIVRVRIHVRFSGDLHLRSMKWLVAVGISISFVQIMKTSLLCFLVWLSIVTSIVGQRAWEKPGCHLLGHTRTIKIERCVKFQVTTNACRGYCLSYAHPSLPATLEKNPYHLLTSKGECCSIAETHDVIVRVRCLADKGGTEYRTLTFKSAKSCSCSVCRSL